MKQNITYTYNDAIEPEEMTRLYVSVGWGTKDDYAFSKVKRSIAQTKHVVTARNEQGLLVGMVRMLDDGWTFAVIADIIVHPEYQRYGIGSALLSRIEKKVPFAVYAPIFEYNENFFLKNGYTHPNAAMKVVSKRIA